MTWKTKWRRGRLPATLAAATLVVAACGSSNEGSSKKDAEATTLVAYTGQSTDYQVNYNPSGSANIGGIGTIFEPLFYSNLLKADPPAPRLGATYAWNANGTQLSITLREGVKWSDGEKFTSRDVVFARPGSEGHRR